MFRDRDPFDGRPWDGWRPARAPTDRDRKIEASRRRAEYERDWQRRMGHAEQVLFDQDERMARRLSR